MGQPKSLLRIEGHCLIKHHDHRCFSRVMQILQQIRTIGRCQRQKKRDRVPAADHDNVQQLQVEACSYLSSFVLMSLHIITATRNFHSFSVSHSAIPPSLRYMECADVDMGLCVSQFSGPPLDDLLPSSPALDSSHSLAVRKGEAGT